MGLFDAFDAGDEQRAEAGRFRALKKGYNRGDDLVQDYGGQERDQYRTAMPEIYSFLDKGVDQAAPYLQASREPYQELFDTGMGGVDRYGQLLGMGGDSAQMQAMLESIPGYQFTRDQGIQAIDRASNSKGNPYNATEVAQYVTGLADQNYFKYLTAHNPYFGMAQGGAAGLAGANTQLANLYNQLGINKGNTAQWGYGGIADSLAGEGSARTNLALAKAGAKGNQIINNQTHQNNADAAMWDTILKGGSALIGMV